jgi:hypothetical protein
MGNTSGKHNTTKSERNENDVFESYRILSYHPDIRVGTVKPQENMKYGSQALKFNGDEKPYRLLNVNHITGHNKQLNDFYLGKAQALCYDFENHYRLCFKKNADIYSFSDNDSPIVMTLEDTKRDFLGDMDIKRHMCPGDYKPLGCDNESAQLDLIDDFIKKNYRRG